MRGCAGVRRHFWAPVNAELGLGGPRGRLGVYGGSRGGAWKCAGGNGVVFWWFCFCFVVFGALLSLLLERGLWVFAELGLSGPRGRLGVYGGSRGGDWRCAGSSGEELGSARGVTGGSLGLYGRIPGAGLGLYGGFRETARGCHAALVEMMLGGLERGVR